MSVFSHHFFKSLFIFLFPIILVLGSGTISYAGTLNCYNYLLMPTQITKINNIYFIVDSNHDQILYNDHFDPDLTKWNVMTRNVSGPHAIAGDDSVYMVADTENNRLLTFSKSGDTFNLIQTFDNIGIRPHYVVYNSDNETFYALSSMTGELYLYTRSPDSNMLVFQGIRHIPEYEHCYIRSFTISGNYLLLPVIEKSCISVVDINTFEILQEYPVPDSLSGMVQISPIGNYFYLTVSTDKSYDQSKSTIVRAHTLEDFALGNYESIYKLFGNNGTPYFISSFDGSYYLIHENEAPNVYRFRVYNDVISDIKGFF